MNIKEYLESLDPEEIIKLYPVFGGSGKYSGTVKRLLSSDECLEDLTYEYDYISKKHRVIIYNV